MPNYEYRCHQCEKVFDVTLSIAEHEQARPRCPHCNGEDVVPILSSFQARTSRKS